MDDQYEGDLGPWNPGLRSTLPRAARALSTVYRPENIIGTLDQALERSAFTGLEPEDLVAFRPERLVVHEVLIRVTGDISVSDGERYADLGINFRSIVDTILKRDIQPVMGDIVVGFERLRDETVEAVRSALSALERPRPQDPPIPSRSGRRGLLSWLGLERRRNPASSKAEGPEDGHEARMLATWREESLISTDPQRRRVSRALAQIVGAVAVRHGRIPSDVSSLVEIAVDTVLNDHGSAVVGEMIAPLIHQAAEREGFGLLPAQAEPVVMNVKGASAAGKSTLRPLQRQLARHIGIDWADFALISPDIWRKYLLDYDSLGDHWRYAGMLTSAELKIVDQKLDRYMAEKARQGRISHLLIDRFRFDSFAETEGGEQGARLLTRFGSTVYMFFVITPPDATVERAWKRGLEVGRFKAVDDLLHHNVEAFTGMPDLFFTWALRNDKRVHYEFLDNSVPAGQRPRTVAFGWNGDMTLLDIKGFLNVDRYRRIHIDAGSPAEVYPDADAMAPEANTGFLKRCVQRIARITLAHQASGRVIAHIEGGRLIQIDADAAEEASADPDVRASLHVLAPRDSWAEAERMTEPVFLDRTEATTLGAYGSAPSALV